MIKIDKKIVGYAVVTKDEISKRNEPAIEQMHEKVRRPETMSGCTYKVRTPLSEHSLYVTINDIVLNRGTAHEVRRPFEMFINSKNMDHFQWIVALTRLVSAVFRKGGDCTFIIEEFRSVFDPKGGYIKKGGGYVPSLVAEIGTVIETHFRAIGMLAPASPDDAMLRLAREKRAEYEAKLAAEQSLLSSAEDTDEEVSEGGDSGDDSKGPAIPAAETDNPGEIPPGGIAGAKKCPNCLQQTMIKMNNCDTCLSCGWSKCQ